MSKKKKPTIIDNSSDSIEALDMKIESIERSIYDISKQLYEVSSDTLDDSYECEGDCYCSKCHFEDSTDEDTNENCDDTNECEIEETSIDINENALTKDDQSIIDTNEKDQISEITKSQDNDNIHDKKKIQDAINIQVKNSKKGHEHVNTKVNNNQIHDNSIVQDTLHKSNGPNTSPKNDSSLDLKGIEQTPKYIRIIDTPPSPHFPKIDSHLLFNFFNPNFQFNFLFHFEKHSPMMKQNNIKNIKSTETQRRNGNKSGREDEIEQIEKKYIEKYEKSVKGKFEKSNNQQKDVNAYKHTDNANNSTGNSNYKIIDNTNKFTDSELHTQIENDPFYNFNCDNDPFYNRYPCSYSTFIDPTFNDFSTPDNRYSHFLKNPIANLTNIFNRPYSAPPRSLIERIDSEHPNFESSEYKGCSRATTPIGFHPFLKEIRISDNYKNEFENEIELYLNQNDGRKTEGGYKTNLETQGSYKNIPNKSDTKNVDELTNKKVFSVEQGDTINNSVFLCMDQEGSRFIQKRLEKSTKKEIQWFYYSIKSHLKTLCLDLFGNYVIQKIIDLKLINDDISLSLIPFVKELSLHMYGCRVIQKILDHDNNTIMDIIKENAILLIEDQNGNHVIQKCVEKNGDINLIGIYKAHTIKLCKHRYGCRVIQRLFEHCDDSAVIDIILNLTKEIEMMMEDQYGNYVLQHIIENKVNLRNIIIDSILCIGRRKVGDKNDKKGVNKKKTNVKTSETITKVKNAVGSSDTNLKMTVSDKFTIVNNNLSSTENSYLKRVDALNLDDYDTARLLHFCSHKFASNVIEKCVMYSPLFVDIFLRKVNGKPMVVYMASDKFGNYVVQRVLDNKMVRNCLKQWCSELKKSVYAKHILSKIQ